MSPGSTPWASSPPTWRQPAPFYARLSLDFKLGTLADVDTKYAELTAAGYEGLCPPWDAAWGMRYATVLDPDGNGVDLYAPLP